MRWCGIQHGCKGFVLRPTGSFGSGIAACAPMPLMLGHPAYQQAVRFDSSGNSSCNIPSCAPSSNQTGPQQSGHLSFAQQVNQDALSVPFANCWQRSACVKPDRQDHFTHVVVNVSGSTGVESPFVTSCWNSWLSSFVPCRALDCRT